MTEYPAAKSPYTPPAARPLTSTCSPMVIGVEPHILLRLRLRPVLTWLCALGIFDRVDREDAMPEENDTPKPDLPDYVKEYFTGRQKDLKLLDRKLPETRDVL